MSWQGAERVSENLRAAAKREPSGGSPGLMGERENRAPEARHCFFFVKSHRRRRPQPRNLRHLTFAANPEACCPKASCKLARYSPFYLQSEQWTKYIRE